MEMTEAIKAVDECFDDFSQALGGKTGKRLEMAYVSLAKWEAVKAGLDMTEERAREILGNKINKDDRLYLCEGVFVSWFVGDLLAEVDGEYTADELEAIAWWMRNKGGEDGNN